NKNENIIKQLNNLVEINNDRIQGYEKAVKETKDNDLKSLFQEMVSHSRKFKMELSSQVSALGGTPTEGTKTSGKFFRAWMDLKAALTGKDRKAVLQSCETGEDEAIATYDEVLKSDANFDEEVRGLILTQKNGLQKDHANIKRLRDTVLA
ncbi:MAG: ferritin-like domain-containing protein, partial [Bacteroidia bacterium]